MQVNVRAKAKAKTRARRQQPGSQVQRHALEVVAEHSTQSRIDTRHQRQGRQEVLAELSIRDPWLAGGQALEREMVDQHRRDAAQLDVVRRGITQREASLDRGQLDVQC